MKKEKRINKVLKILLVILILIIAIVVIIFVKRNSQQLAAEENLKFEKVPINMVINERDTEDTMPNQNYVENQVIAVADSKREAKKIAKQIGGELLSYDNQVAIIQIGITVEEMMQMLEEDSSLPKVYPNYQGYQNYTN